MILGFDERKFGIDSYNELLENFEEIQKDYPSFNMKNGESQNDIASRMYNSIYNVLNKFKGKRVVIVSHATSMTFLFMKLGTYKDNNIYFNDQVLIDENFIWDAPSVFKLLFVDNQLVSIENIKMNF